jgi:hypothetical protein
MLLYLSFIDFLAGDYKSDEEGCSVSAGRRIGAVIQNGNDPEWEE